MRVFLSVIDGFGVGELPDAHLFKDEGSNTFGNLYNKEPFELPFLYSLGLKNIDNIGVPKFENEIIGAYGKMAEKCMAKDTTAGHFEISGVSIEKPFVTFPNGIPSDLVEKFENAIGTKTLCNDIASGTAIINKLGDEHIKTGYPIVYTSADSVFQIACHEKVYPVEKLYEFCQIAREMTKEGKYQVGRVIARPFDGESGNYYRTSRRKDFAIEAPGDTILDIMKEKGFASIGVGKIEDIFAFRGLTDSYHTVDNKTSIEKMKELLSEDFEGLVFTNLIDTDMQYGHRNDCEGYKNCLIETSKALGEFAEKMGDDDILIVTSDHGNDPTTPSTDHSREYTPIMIYGKKIKQGVNLGVLPDFTVVSDFIKDLFNISKEKGIIYKGVIAND